MRKRTSNYDIQTNVEHCRLMLVDWESGLEKTNIIHKYGITEHGYKLFNKQCKDRGYQRAGSTKGTLDLMFEQIALMPHQQQTSSPAVSSKVQKSKVVKSTKYDSSSEEEGDVFGHKKSSPSYNAKFPNRR